MLCDFSEFTKQGYEIEFGEAVISTDINEDKIIVDVNQRLNIRFGEASWTGNSHSIDVDSSLGKFYDLATKIYDQQNEDMFLERYGIDILRLYAPVDGSEIGCSPKIWSVSDIREDLTTALASNIPAIKVKGDYYDLAREENKYFVQDLGFDVEENVNFLFSQYDEDPLGLQHSSCRVNGVIYDHSPLGRKISGIIFRTY